MKQIVEIRPNNNRISSSFRGVERHILSLKQFGKIWKKKADRMVNVMEIALNGVTQSFFLCQKSHSFAALTWFLINEQRTRA